MHCVYSNSMAYVLAYLLAGTFLLLIKNYFKYASSGYNLGFLPVTLSELFQVLLYGGPGTRFIKPIQVSSHYDLAKQDLFDVDEPSLLGERRYDHMEFPFSDGRHYAKKTLSEACVDISSHEKAGRRQSMTLSSELLFLLSSFMLLGIKSS